MTALRAFAELNPAGTRIEVHFRYSPEAVEAVRAVPGRKFHGDANPKFWSVPLDLDSGRRLREEFGDGLQLGDALKAWGREEVRRQRQLHSLTTADDAELERVRAEQVAWLRPYQRADVKMMATTNVLNANQPGVGKTVEVIYAVEERGERGLHLVLAPITLHKDPWMDELAIHAPHARVYAGETPAQRKVAMAEALADHAANPGDDIWLILNPDMIRCQRREPEPGESILSRDHKGNAYVAKPEVAALFQTDYQTVTLDEFHKYGLGEDRNTLFARAAAALAERSTRRYALSGTPMGGKAIRLWGVLYFIEPQAFGSKWRWAEKWLQIEDDGYGKKIGGLIPGREKEFNAAHAKFMVRRNRADALPGLPPKVVIDVMCPMTKTQRKAYDEFAKGAEVALEGGRVSADGILAEFARLKQFANAKCEVRDGDVVPTMDSGKLLILLDRLDTHGIGKDGDPAARGIVASESARFVRLLEEYLAGQGIAVRRLDGSVTGAKRTAVIDWYKDLTAEEPRVLVMTTQTGGVGLNLGMTSVICIMDETWSPDDQEQLEDRGMRNRTTPLNVLYFRTEESIQEYIWETTRFKARANVSVLDLRAAIKDRKTRQGVELTPGQARAFDKATARA